MTFIIHVFYCPQMLSEQVPCDAATFTCMTPLISQTFLSGGFPGLDEGDDPMEQVALALEITGKCVFVPDYAKSGS